MILLAALAGLAVTGGIVLLGRGLLGRGPDPGTPPRRGQPRLTRSGRRRAVLAAAAALLVYLLTRWPVGGLAAAAAVLFLPKLGGGGQRQRTEMLEGLEQWIRRLADMVTASRGLEDALGASARSAPAAVAEPVERLAGRLASRSGTEPSLRAFAAEIDDPAGDRIAAALIIATGRRGGGARDVLVALAVLLARDVAARREIEAERAQHRTTVRWIGMFVGGFTVFSVLNHSYSAPFGTVAGQIVLALVALLYAAGLAWLHRLGNLPTAGRFLDDSLARDPSRPAVPAQLPPGVAADLGRPR
ncbi:MAG TPA: type II secretion system F family protein [Streptosporangiaceae bacterium]|nr:type II secretion system F family protein [Streptosporangiaceae bacterium]